MMYVVDIFHDFVNNTDTGTFITMEVGSDDKVGDSCMGWSSALKGVL